MLATNKLVNVPYSRYDQIQSSLRKKRKEILIFLEHSSSITGGINYNMENLLVSESFLRKKGVDLQFIKRGGDFTAHEKGQLVIYPHIDLKKRNLGISAFIELFLNSIKVSIKKTWDLDVILKNSEPGLYLKNSPEKKLVSVGINFKSYFTSFGAAFNIANNLETFSYINPCGKKSEDLVSIKNLGLDPWYEKDFIENFKKDFMSLLFTNSFHSFNPDLK